MLFDGHKLYAQTISPTGTSSSQLYNKYFAIDTDNSLQNVEILLGVKENSQGTQFRTRRYNIEQEINSLNSNLPTKIDYDDNGGLSLFHDSEKLHEDSLRIPRYLTYWEGEVKQETIDLLQQLLTNKNIFISKRAQSDEGMTGECELMLQKGAGSPTTINLSYTNFDLTISLSADESLISYQLTILPDDGGTGRSYKTDAEFSTTLCTLSITSSDTYSTYFTIL